MLKTFFKYLLLFFLLLKISVAVYDYISEKTHISCDLENDIENEEEISFEKDEIFNEPLEFTYFNLNKISLKKRKYYLVLEKYKELFIDYSTPPPEYNS